MKTDQASVLADKYMATIGRLTDRTPLPVMTEGVVRAAIRAAVTEGIALGRTSMHDDLLAEHRL